MFGYVTGDTDERPDQTGPPTHLPGVPGPARLGVALARLDVRRVRVAGRFASLTFHIRRESEGSENGRGWGRRVAPTPVSVGSRNDPTVSDNRRRPEARRAQPVDDWIGTEEKTPGPPRTRRRAVPERCANSGEARSWIGTITLMTTVFIVIRIPENCGGHGFRETVRSRRRMGQAAEDEERMSPNGRAANAGCAQGEPDCAPDQSSARVIRIDDPPRLAFCWHRDLLGQETWLEGRAGRRLG